MDSINQAALVLYCFFFFPPFACLYAPPVDQYLVSDPFLFVFVLSGLALNVLWPSRSAILEIHFRSFRFSFPFFLFFLLSAFLARLAGWQVASYLTQVD